MLTVDLLAPLAWSLVGALNDDLQHPPIVIAYNQFLRDRIAVGLEGQVGGIATNERRTGLAAQSHFYLTDPDNFGLLDGLYAAPRLRYLRTQYMSDYASVASLVSKWAGAELLLGQQRPAAPWLVPGLVTNAAMGVGYWCKIVPDSRVARPDDDLLMRPGWQLTIRLSLGYRF
ncbi:hypothetical protein [Hymenobacter rigui]|uniref:DUF3575 domain-containing protein n=1 Tax=Hymenobacter rigui TaxID=334424 RepID=A0A428KSM0_9BACT|nr:hypothetical protein [Hymenobacter rigui]RSK49528.1 hypothetical protein EI291_08540 [Hymenobacter rigui]